MIKMLKSLDASALEAELNSLGPSIEVLSIYSINQLHFAWIRVPEAEKAPVIQSKVKMKGTK